VSFIEAEGRPQRASSVDQFEVTLYPAIAECPRACLRFRQARISINGVPLLELVRAGEEPWARSEYLQRLSECENPEEFKFDPGDYQYLTAAELLLPSRELLGQPSDPEFVLSPDDSRRTKATVLGCTCGITECWFIQARVELLPERVIWSDFGQFHRPHWSYDFGPFTFDRNQYESQLAQDEGLAT
jgi:hypothetical protein